MIQNNPESDFQPEIVVLYCQSAVAADADLEMAAQSTRGFSLRAVQLPCSSKIEAAYLFKLLEQGADGVLVVGCPEEKCQFLVGSARATKRVAYARRLLAQAGLGEDRLGLEKGTGLTARQVLELAEARAQAVRPQGRNPMKREIKS